LTPLVSFVMPVRNGQRYLREAVESVLRQTVSDLELIAVDDGSSDASGDILNEYATTDSRVVVLRTEAIGQAEARNAAVAIARAEAVAFLDHDDVAYPDRVERQLAFLSDHEDVALVGGALTFIDRAGRVFAESVRYPVTDAEIRDAFSHTTPILQSAATIRRSAFHEAGGYRRLFADSEDLDLWLRVADRHRLANLEEPVVHYRIHAGQSTAIRMERQSMTSLGARLSARARAAGRPEPFEGAHQLGRDVLVAAGATEEEIAESFVVPATWMAKTLYRAGDADAARALLDEAEVAAKAAPSPGALAEIDRARATIGRRALLGRLRALVGRGR
jgi:hypothetical protein